MLVAIAFLAVGETQLHSTQQTDSVVTIVADAQGLPFVPAQDRLPCGTYWEVRNSLPCLGAPLPCSPSDPDTPVYAVGGNHFLVDQTAGPLVPPLPSAYRNRDLSSAGYAAILAAQLAELHDFVTQVQASESSAQMSVVDLDLPAGSMPTGWPPRTNDLWLEILSMSVSNATASLVIHPPWNVTNGVYDLLYCTNLAPPISWQWLLRTDPGQTNLTVANVTVPQGFCRLGLPNDLAATSSLGTNFWLGFFSVAHNPDLDLSLYISSPGGATGTVTVAGLGITNAFSVAAGAVTNIGIPPEAMIVAYDVVQTNGIHIAASQPVSVYAVA